MYTLKIHTEEIELKIEFKEFCDKVFHIVIILTLDAS